MYFKSVPQFVLDILFILLLHVPINLSCNIVPDTAMLSWRASHIISTKTIIQLSQELFSTVMDSPGFGMKWSKMESFVVINVI